MTTELNLLQSAHANVMRVDIDWRTMEWSGRGIYDSTYLAQSDTLVSGAAQRGIKVLYTIATTPPWASSGGAWNDPPTNPSDYGNFAKFITGRYGTKLAGVEVWNEPEINNNLIAYSGQTLAQTYTAMAKAFYQGAKAGNINVDVLVGALSYADTNFLGQLYADGIKGYYDGLSFHPYADQAPPSTCYTHSFICGIENMHNFQLNNGDNTPEWIDEFGDFTCPALTGSCPAGSATGAVNQDTQASDTKSAYSLVQPLSYVKAAIIYQLRDMCTTESDPECNFGLVQSNFAQRPAYSAFAAAMAAE
jgi:polysaccharide biosynthesis protein PslG